MSKDAAADRASARVLGKAEPMIAGRFCGWPDGFAPLGPCRVTGHPQALGMEPRLDSRVRSRWASAPDR
ncbi:hypothetical protein ACIBI9_33455 [Nonomuraea sp. NPDC050451]|uniref:hypothetical protein n=1 Tax=Nonomuraea sp. NPDC050451 TaxID=3364364 RepID=UPI00379F7896